MRFDSGVDHILATTEKGNPVRQISFLGLALIGIISILSKGVQPFSINGWLGSLTILFGIWSVASLIWTEDPFLTFKRLVVFMSFCLAAYAMASRFSLEMLPFFALVIFGVYVVIGLSLEIGLRTFHPTVPEYRFSGTLHPNSQAINCGLMSLAATALAIRKNAFRWLSVLLGILALTGLLLTKSRTAFWSSLVAQGVLIYFGASRKKKVLSILGLGWLLALLFLLFSDAILADISGVMLLGREDPDVNVGTFQGRTRIWELCLNYILNRPIQGYGFNSFWTVSRIREVYGYLGSGLTGSHSGYIEMVLSLGVVGMSLAAVVLGISMKRAWNKCWKGGGSGPRFFVMLGIFAILNSTMESAWVHLCLGTFFLMWGIAYFAFVEKGGTPSPDVGTTYGFSPSLLQGGVPKASTQSKGMKQENACGFMHLREI